jgi:hypothetical protein
MGKYQPLEAFLSGCEADETTMSFEEIEAVIGADLPEAAHTHRAWWSNNPSNNVMTRCWLAAGYRTERVDMAARRLVFRRADGMAATRRVANRARIENDASAPLLERLWKSLAGTVRVPDGVDLVDPIGDSWCAKL